jgi:hypothetical protein
MLNVSRLQALMELYAGQAGVAKDRINPVLLREIINIKLKEFVNRTGLVSSKYTIHTEADKAEYTLPSSVISVDEVHVDGYRAIKILFEQVAVLQGVVQ